MGRSTSSGGGYSQSRGGARDGGASHGQARHGGGGQPTQASASKRAIPTETNAEVFYYKKQMDAHTLMVIVLQDGEEIEGTIEWYDRGALKINRRRMPNIMLLKHNIKYMYKAEDRAGGSSSGDEGDGESVAPVGSDTDDTVIADDGGNETATANGGGSKRATGSATAKK